MSPPPFLQHQSLQLHRAPQEAKASAAKQLGALRTEIAAQQLQLDLTRQELQRVRAETAELATELDTVTRARQRLVPGGTRRGRQGGASGNAGNSAGAGGGRSAGSAAAQRRAQPQTMLAETGMASPRRVNAAVQAAIAKAKARFAARQRGTASPQPGARPHQVDHGAAVRGSGSGAHTAASLRIDTEANSGAAGSGSATSVADVAVALAPSLQNLLNRVVKSNSTPRHGHGSPRATGPGTPRGRLLQHRPPDAVVPPTPPARRQRHWAATTASEDSAAARSPRLLA